MNRQVRGWGMQAIVMGAGVGMAWLVQAASTTLAVPLGEVSVPAGYTLLAEASGDLNRDGQNELVLVLDTGEDGDLGSLRELRIYQRQQQQWRLWHTSRGAVLPSQHGGMMGDPFVGVDVKQHALVIEHFGGSRQKWSYVHRYRFQQHDWHLIGATINFGAPCDRQESYDYNLSTGGMKVVITLDDCDSEQLSEQKHAFKLKRAGLPKMDGFYPGDNELTLPKKDLVVYY